VVKSVDKLDRDGLWVDVFSGSYFSGRLRRFRPNAAGTPAVYEDGRQTKIRSIIVGPNAIAKVTRASGAESVELSPGTVLADTSRLANGKQRLRIVVEPVSV
jgi:hypothetical protein